MKNFSNNLISFSTIIIAVSFSYYFVIYLPSVSIKTSNQEIADIKQEKQAECKVKGERLWSLDYHNLGSNISDIGGPFFHYNTKLKNCLMEYKTTVQLEGTSGDIIGMYSIFSYYIVNLDRTENFGYLEDSNSYHWKDNNFLYKWEEQPYIDFKVREADLMGN
jgi:hypothetical protein